MSSMEQRLTSTMQGTGDDGYQGDKEEVYQDSDFSIYQGTEEIRIRIH
jgi:hypothetical protein